MSDLSLFLPNFDESPTLYLVGYSHLDAQWCWCYPLVIDEMLRNTLYENFSCLEASTSYIINFPAANRYRSFKEFYPLEYERLKSYVKEGRWFPAGSSLEECDVLVPSPESIIRNILYGNLFFEEELGVCSDEFMLPDCFGFPATLPSLLSHCGLKGFSTQKLSWRSANGIPFNYGWWEGPDGNGILSALNGGSYLTTITNNWAHDEKLLSRLKQNALNSDGLLVDLLYIGTGDQGGAAGIESAQWMDRLSTDSSSPIHFISARADQIFNDTTPEQIEKLKKRQYSGDLLLIEHSAGSLTSQSYMKHWFRQSEVLLLNTEPVAVMATYFDQQPYPLKALREGWYLTSLLMFHDILPGTSLPKAYEYSHNDALLGMRLTSGILFDSVSALSDLFTQVYTPKEISLLLYNGLSHERNEVVQAKIQGLSPQTQALQAFDSVTGSPLPIQILQQNKDGSFVVLLQAMVPSCGFKMVLIKACEHADQPTDTLRISKTDLENPNYKVSLNSHGDIVSIWDKMIQKELLSAPIRMAFMHDEPTNYPSWNMDWKDRKFLPKGYLEGEANIKIIEQGPVRISLEVERWGENSHFSQQIRLYNGGLASRRVEFSDLIDWRAKATTLKACFPLTAQNPLATYSWECSTIERDNNRANEFEVPSHQWIDLMDRSLTFGVALLTNHKYGSDKPSDQELRLTLLYTPGISRNLHHQHQETQDWGRHEFVYGIMGHDGSCQAHTIDFMAQSLNQPLLAFELQGNHQGKLGGEYSLLQIDHPAIKMMSLKHSERSNDFVLRLNNFSSHSISKVKISFGEGFKSAQFIDGQEHSLHKSPCLVNGNLELDFSPFEIITLAFTPIKNNMITKSMPSYEQISLPLDTLVTSKRKEPFSQGFAQDFKGMYRYPSELFPKDLTIDSCHFHLSISDKKAMRCQGQKLSLPSGSKRLIAIVTSTLGNRTVQFSFGDSSISKEIPSWNGYYGQWDTRLWDRHEPKITWEWGPLYCGLRHGYLSSTRPVWFCQHYHNHRGESQTYQYAYLYAISLDVPEGETCLTLPQDNQIVLFALASSSESSKIKLSSAIIDFPTYQEKSLNDIRFEISPNKNDCREVTLLPPWYHEKDIALEVSLNHSPKDIALEVSLNHSPFVPYSRPITLYEDTLVLARVGKSGTISQLKVEVNDITPPTIIHQRHCLAENKLEIIFSEPIDASSLFMPDNITIEGNKILEQHLSPDGRCLLLTCSNPCSADTKVYFSQIRDCSPNKNSNQHLAITIPAPRILKFEQVFDCSSQGFDFPGNGLLPCNQQDPWTMNVFVMPTEPLINNILIAGFGPLSDEPEENWGGSRFIGKTHTGTCFWFNKMDTGSWIEYDLNKWQMITVTWDGTTYYLYKNGVEIAKGTGRINALAEDHIYLAPRATWETEENQQKPFVGYLGRFMIIDQVLSQDEILQLIEDVPEQRINYKTMHMMI